MQKNKLKNLMSILLIATAVLHLVVAVTGAPEAIRIPLAAFGLLYGGLGVWLRTGGRTAVLATLGVTAIGLLLGGTNYLQNGGPMTLPVMFLIDLAVLGAGALWLMKPDAAN